MFLKARIATVFSSWVQDDFPELLALLQPLVSGSGFAQRETPVHYRLQLAGENVLHDLVELALRAHERAEERKLAGKKKADVERGFRAGGGAACHQFSAGLERLHALIPGSFPHVRSEEH